MSFNYIACKSYSRYSGTHALLLSEVQIFVLVCAFARRLMHACVSS